MLLKNKFYTGFSAYCGLIKPRLCPFSGISDTIFSYSKEPSDYTQLLNSNRLGSCFFSFAQRLRPFILNNTLRYDSLYKKYGL